MTGKTPKGTALYSVKACAPRDAAVSLTAGNLEQALERAGVPITDQRLAQATVERARNSGKLAFLGGLLLEIGETGGVAVPALQGAGVIRGSPWIGGASAGVGFVLNRIRRVREKRQEPIATLGPWLQEWAGTEIHAGDCWPRLFALGGYLPKQNPVLELVIR